MRKVQFAEGEYYHIYNRGVDKRQTFMNDDDRYRFLHDLFELNDKNAAPVFSRRIKTAGSPTSYSKKPRKTLVEIICFCLMPNHFHLILKQLVDKGISMFMQKLGTGYTNFFNKKYERSGALFQGKFKSAHIKTDEQMLYLNRYIHLNPVDLFQPKWKDQGIKDLEGARKFLKKYKWTSCLDYVGIKNYPSLVNKQFVLASYFNGEEDYEKFLMSGLVEDDLSKIEQIIIEE